MKDFMQTITDKKFELEITNIRNEVEMFAKQFPSVGYDTEARKYKH